MKSPGPGGVRWSGRKNPFPAPTARAYGNQLPAVTGDNGPPQKPAPGYWHVNGQLGGTGDGAFGADPRAPKISPAPVSPAWKAWGQGQAGTGQAEQSFRRYGTLGFNDQLTTKDRHAYWDAGHQRTGTTFDPASTPPNTYNDPMMQPPSPLLRLVNRTVSFQVGSDATRNQDDLSRPYTWLGEMGTPWVPRYGGVPGLYQPYGTRGGVPYPIVSPAQPGSPQDGPVMVTSGPPHGLHSQTPWAAGQGNILQRYEVNPQMRPVRLDRPSNSPQAGQSYSQTVRPQGASPVRPSGGQRQGPQFGGRGWAGVRKG